MATLRWNPDADNAFLLNLDNQGLVLDRVTDLHAAEFASDIDFINS